MRISFFALSFALCWLTLLPYPARSSLLPSAHLKRKDAKTTSYAGIVDASGSYKPTIGIETEVKSFMTFCNWKKKGETKQLKVHHEARVAFSKATSPFVSSLPLSYIQLDGVPLGENGGDSGYLEFTLGPHSLEELKIGLTDEQQLIRTLSAQPEKKLHPMEAVLKTVPHPKSEYKLTIDQESCREGQWEYKSPGSYPDRDIDTQITYSFPLAKVTSDAFAQMPRNHGFKQPQKFQAAKTFAAEVINAYPELSGDKEVAGLLTLFFHFAAGFTLCSPVNDPRNSDPSGGCYKNWDGQQIKADLWTISMYLRGTNPHYAAFADKHLSDKGVRDALITRFHEFLANAQNIAIQTPDQLSLVFYTEYFEEHMQHLLFLLFAPDDKYASICKSAQDGAGRYIAKAFEDMKTGKTWERLHVDERGFFETKLNKRLRKAAERQTNQPPVTFYDKMILGLHYTPATKTTPPFSPFALKLISVTSVVCTLKMATKQMDSTLVTVGDKKYLYILAESRWTGGEISQKTFANRAFAPLSSVNFASLDQDRQRHWDFLAALQEPPNL